MLKNIMAREDLHPKVIVSVRSPVTFFGKKEIRDALTVVNWHMPASINPMGYAISLHKDDSIRKMISESGNFVVNFISSKQDDLVRSCEGKESSIIDLFSTLGIKKKEGVRVESPRLDVSSVFLECEVIQELDSGDHTLFLGRVLHSENR
jgi:flavin reductase (DIM6/NTAB) family NADH-FMN oxidoreductase RutF